MPTTLALRATSVAADLLERVPTNEAVLAEPPSGSGLKPVLGDYGPPVVGHTLAWMADGLAFGRDRLKRWGPISWSGGMGTKVVSVVGPDAIEEVLTNSDS